MTHCEEREGKRKMDACNKCSYQGYFNTKEKNRGKLFKSNRLENPLHLFI